MQKKWIPILILCLIAVKILSSFVSCDKESLSSLSNVATPCTEHIGKYWTIEKIATADENGKKHQICSICGATFNEKDIPSVTVERVPVIADTYQDPLRPSYELGICRNLRGTPVVVLLFIDDDKSSWTEKEVLAFTKEHILPGLEYLEDNALAWGVDLNFIIESYSTSFSDYDLKYEGVVNPYLYNGGSTKDVVDKAAEDMEIGDNWDFYSYYKALYPDDDIIFLNFINKSGKSYARHIITTGYLQYSEQSVIFADHYGSSPFLRSEGSRASTVAHELLHLFGAEDFYSPSAREALADKEYPNDIMLWQYDNINRNRIGDCTAFSVGWTDTVPDVCYNDEWWTE